MRYCRFLHEGKIKFGMVDVDKVVELTGSFLNPGVAPTNHTYDLGGVKLLSPVSPKQVVAIGLNYLDHAKEQNKSVPEEPMMFMVSPSAVIGPDETIQLQRSDHRIDFEAELAIVIGKTAHRVPAKEAKNYIFGYTIGNDVSDRHLQKKDGQFTRAKSFSTYKPLGPFVSTGLNPDNLSIELQQNGTVKQSGSTSDFIHSVEEIVATVTEVMTLYPGDVILTGTPAGVSPLRDGDSIEITIEGIGTLHNSVK